MKFALLLLAGALATGSALPRPYGIKGGQGADQYLDQRTDDGQLGPLPSLPRYSPNGPQSDNLRGPDPAYGGERGGLKGGPTPNSGAYGPGRGSYGPGGSSYGPHSGGLRSEPEGYGDPAPGGLKGGRPQGSGSYGPESGSYGPERGSYGPERGSYGPERGSYGPERGSYGPERGSYGPERGSYGPESGSYGPERGSYGPERGSHGPERGSYEPERGYGPVGGRPGSYAPPSSSLRQPEERSDTGSYGPQAGGPRSEPEAGYGGERAGAGLKGGRPQSASSSYGPYRPQSGSQFAPEERSDTGYAGRPQNNYGPQYSSNLRGPEGMYGNLKGGRPQGSLSSLQPRPEAGYGSYGPESSRTGSYAPSPNGNLRSDTGYGDHGLEHHGLKGTRPSYGPQGAPLSSLQPRPEGSLHRGPGPEERMDGGVETSGPGMGPGLKGGRPQGGAGSYGSGSQAGPQPLQRSPAERPDELGVKNNDSEIEHLVGVGGPGRGGLSPVSGNLEHGAGPVSYGSASGPQEPAGTAGPAPEGEGAPSTGSSYGSSSNSGIKGLRSGSYAQPNASTTY